MTVPAGNTGAAGRPPPVDGAAATEAPDPRRPKPPDVSMADFLMQIGSEHRPEPQDAGQRFQTNAEEQIEQALILGDIVQIGTTDVEQVGCGDGQIGGDQDQQVGGYPIYKVLGPAGSEEIKFTLDPRYGELVTGYPPEIVYQAGKIYLGMDNALWGVFRHDHPTEQGATEKYEDLLRGMAWRYAGEDQEPQFAPRTDLGQP